MDKKFIGIVLKVIDYKEKDKLVNIFSANEGLLLCKLKSVKGHSAKLKAFASPFCFAEFIANSGSNNKNMIITGGSVLETFFDITKDIDRYIVGCAVLDFTHSLLEYKTEDSVELFACLIKTLKALNYFSVDCRVVLLKFLLDVLAIYGYELNFEYCSCGNSLSGGAVLDFKTGEVVCKSCKSDGKEIGIDDLKLFGVVKRLKLEEDIEMLVDKSLIDSTLKTIGNYIYVQFGYTLKIADLFLV